MPPPSKNKILVIKHGALGDILQAMDAFASIREAHSGAHLAVLTTPPFVEFLRGAPYFDAVLIDPRAPFYRLDAWWRMWRVLRAGWTRIYDLQGTARTAHYLRYFLRGMEVDFIGKATAKGDFSGMNNCDRLLAIIGEAGVESCVADMDWLGTGTGTAAWAGKKMTGTAAWAGKKMARVNLPHPYAVLVAGCSPAKPSKRWSAENYGALARALLADGITPVLVGTRYDAQVGAEICAMEPAAMSLIGDTNLAQLADVLRGAAAVIGNDTGPVFLAARLDVPTLMLMGRDTDAVKSAPIGKRALWLRADAIDSITPDAVLEKLAPLK